MVIDTLTAFSNLYGSDSELVLAGGGNTSAKDGNTLYIKGSGTSLATITADGFVKMDREKLSAMLKKTYPTSDKEREAEALTDLMAARQPSEAAKRPSVETLLHNLFPQRYVLHLHPALINGLTCSLGGEAKAKELFGDEIVWIELCKPGYILSVLCMERMEQYKAHTGKDASIMLLANHGIFIAADDEISLGEKLNFVLDKLKSELREQPDFTPLFVDSNETAAWRADISALYGEGAVAVYSGSKQAVEFAKSGESVEVLLYPFTPDHIVYCKAHPLFVKSREELKSAFLQYKSVHGYAPKIIIAKELGFFAVSDTEKQAKTAQMLFNDAMKIAVYSQSFGGALHMTEELTDFIVNWEVESYRSKQN